MNILANDGLSKKAIKLFEEKDFQVFTDNIAQDRLSEYIVSNDISILIVRSATVVRKDLIDSCPNIKIIARAGIGMDNIDVKYAINKGINVINTPLSSVRSVAELVFSHILGLVRNLPSSNREMPNNNNFKEMKKRSSNGMELKGKTIGIIGIGNIGKEVVKIALGFEMEVLIYDIIKKEKISIDINLPNNTIKIDLSITKDLNSLIKKSDFISIHTPKLEKPLIGKKELSNMKKSAIIVNTSRGGMIDEDDLVEALDNGVIFGAGLDVFNNESSGLSKKISSNPKLSISPHIAGSTIESQDRIGLELVDKITSIAKKI